MGKRGRKEKIRKERGEETLREIERGREEESKGG